MKRASWVCCAAISSLLLWAAGCWPAFAQEPPSERFSNVRFTVYVDASEALDSPTLPHADDLPYVDVSLPFRFDGHANFGGQRPIGLFRTTFNLATLPGEGLGVYVPNFAGHRVAVYVNGARVSGSTPSVSDPGRFPWLFQVPAAMLHTGSNDLIVAVQAEAHFLIVSAFSIGGMQALHEHFDRRDWLSRTGPQVVCVTVAIVGIIVFSFWLGRRDETAYLYYALGALMWTVRTSHYFFDQLPFNAQWYWWMVLNSMPWLMAFVFLFALRVHRKHYPRLEQFLIGSAVLMTVVTMPVAGRYFYLWGLHDLAYNGQIVLGIGVTTLITVLAWRTHRFATWLLTAALWINAGLGINDMLVKVDHNYLDYEGLYLMPFGAAFLFVSLATGAVQRFLATLNEVEGLNRSLEQRVEDKASELEATYRRLASAQTARAAADERARLMREMHDGLGASLVTSLKLVERGKLGNDQVAEVLRECIDDLRLIIDSLEAIDHDLVALLATLRYRLGQRLEAAGIHLEWQVGDIPPLTWLDQASALHVMRSLQEVLTNALKHAEAHLIRVETGASGDRVYVRVTDDGCGFDVEAQRAAGAGRGLRNLYRRAEMIGGSIDIVSSPAGTRTTLWLPIERDEQVRAA